MLILKNLLNTLYGNLRFRYRSDYITVPLKLAYIVFSIPFLLFALGLWARSLGAIGSPEEEKIGVVKVIFLHIADIFWSSAFWVISINLFLGR